MQPRDIFRLISKLDERFVYFIRSPETTKAALAGPIIRSWIAAHLLQVTGSSSFLTNKINTQKYLTRWLQLLLLLNGHRMDSGEINLRPQQVRLDLTFKIPIKPQ